MKCENDAQALICKNIDIDFATRWRKPDAWCLW